jgi:hypothetical protein
MPARSVGGAVFPQGCSAPGLMPGGQIDAMLKP